MTEHIAILTPTMNRSEFVLRALQYYASIDFRGQLVFGDSSRTEERARLHEYIDQFKDRLRITCHHCEHLPFPNDAWTLKELVDRTDSPYMAFSGDDDLLVPNTLQRCADFLDTHPDFSAAHGIFVTFRLPAPGAFGQIVETSYHPNHILLSDSAGVRWKGYIRHALSTQYYVHRKETWQRMYEHLPRVLSRYLGPEILPCSISAMEGKIAEIDALSVLFQINPERPFGWTTHSIYSLSSEPNWGPAMIGLKEVITDELVRRDGMSASDAALFFDKEMWRHLLIMSQAHYDMRGYEPINIFTNMKRRYQGIVRLWQRIRQLRGGSFRDCSLNSLTKDSHPYHADFTAARRFIEQ
jgi:glycosyltransferase domain-containing protein